MRVRVSLGTITGESMGTAYFMLPRRCVASCRYCRQAWGDEEWLARVKWPLLPVSEALELVEEHYYRRVCIQVTLYPGFLHDLLNLLRHIKSRLPWVEVSATLPPLGAEAATKVARLLDSAGVGLDAATPAVARRWRRPSPWGLYLSFTRLLSRLLDDVSVHLIVGLGETPLELVAAAEAAWDAGASRIALFPYTPPRRGLGSQPSMRVYRWVQLYVAAREAGFEPWSLLGLSGAQEPCLQREPPEWLARQALMTRGCRGCRRPYYTESPRGPLYNHPTPPRNAVEEVARYVPRCE